VVLVALTSQIIKSKMVGAGAMHACVIIAKLLLSLSLSLRFWQCLQARRYDLFHTFVLLYS
jgi:hypothetical protein